MPLERACRGHGQWRGPAKLSSLGHKNTSRHPACSTSPGWTVSESQAQSSLMRVVLAHVKSSALPPGFTKSSIVRQEVTKENGISVGLLAAPPSDTDVEGITASKFSDMP